jgi:glyoxylase-like metal-dependent hydrolase (beta-lactamase superfamily II)
MLVPEQIVAISMPTPFMVGPVNAYLVKADALLLVDTGPKTDAAWEALVDGLKREGVAPRDLDGVLLTHGHIDHVGQLARVLDASGAPAWAHRETARSIARAGLHEDPAADWAADMMRACGAPEEAIAPALGERDAFAPYTEPARISHLLEDGDPAAGRFTALHVPGHSPSDTLFVSEAGLAFTGDHILRRMNPNPLMRRPEPGKPRARSLVQFRESLRRTRALPLAVAYPGHGEPIRDHVRVVDGLLERHDRRTAEVRRFLESGPQSPYEVCRKLFPDLKPEQLFFGLSVALGHLEVLEDDGAARQAESLNGALRFILTAHDHSGA